MVGIDWEGAEYRPLFVKKKFLREGGEKPGRGARSMERVINGKRRQGRWVLVPESPRLSEVPPTGKSRSRKCSSSGAYPRGTSTRPCGPQATSEEETNKTPRSRGNKKTLGPMKREEGGSESPEGRTKRRADRKCKAGYSIGGRRRTRNAYHETGKGWESKEGRGDEAGARRPEDNARDAHRERSYAFWTTARGQIEKLTKAAGGGEPSSWDTSKDPRKPKGVRTFNAN